MALGCISILYIYWKIIIELRLFKMLAEDFGGSPLRRKVAKTIKLISSSFITLPCITKAIQAALLLYISLKAPLTITISIYYMICQSDTYMGT